MTRFYYTKLKFKNSLHYSSLISDVKGKIKYKFFHGTIIFIQIYSYIFISLGLTSFLNQRFITILNQWLLWGDLYYMHYSLYLKKKCFTSIVFIFKIWFICYSKIEVKSANVRLKDNRYLPVHFIYCNISTKLELADQRFQNRIALSQFHLFSKSFYN